MKISFDMMFSVNSSNLRTSRNLCLTSLFAVLLSSLLVSPAILGETVSHKYDFQDAGGVTQEGWTPIEKNTMASPTSAGFVTFGELPAGAANRSSGSTQEPTNVTEDQIYTGPSAVEGETAMQFRDIVPPNATNLSLTIYTSDPQDKYVRENYRITLSYNDGTKTTIWDPATASPGDYMGTYGYYIPITVPSFPLPGDPGTTNYVDVSFESIGVKNESVIRVNGIEFEYTTK